MPITHITFQFVHNCKYEHIKDNPENLKVDKTADLENYLLQDIKQFKFLHELVAELNKDLNRTDILEVIEKIMGLHPYINHKTKKTRTYRISHLIIHEKDN